MRCLVPALAVLLFAAPAGAAKKTGVRIQVFVTPGPGNASEPLAARAEAVLTELLERGPGFRLPDALPILGGAVPADVRSGIVDAHVARDEGLRHFKAGQLDDAEIKLRTARREYEEVIAQVEPEEWGEVLAYLAACAQMKGEDEEARRLLAELALFDPAFPLDKLPFDRAVLVKWKSARADSEGLAKGAASIQSSPQGARIYVDGVHRAFTPTAVRVPVGRHLIQLELPGHEIFGKFVEVKDGEDTAIRATLRSTPEWKKLRPAVEEAVKEVRRELGPRSLKLGERLGLDRMILGTATSSAGRGRIELFLVDLRSKQALADVTQALEGGALSSPDRELARLLRQLLSDGDQTSAKLAGSEAGPPAPGPDPAEPTDEPKRRSRPEGKSEARNTGDPLDSVTGMEDW